MFETSGLTIGLTATAAWLGLTLQGSRIGGSL
jgi:hypothetical protein